MQVISTITHEKPYQTNISLNKKQDLPSGVDVFDDLAGKAIIVLHNNKPVAFGVLHFTKDA